MPFELIAHRGASHDAPENTLAAVHLGWQQGADAVEVDCRITADGQIVVIHDAETGRTAGTQDIVAMCTLAQLQKLDVGKCRGSQWMGERIPTLQSVMDTVPPGKRLFIEVKCSNEITAALVKLLRQAAEPAERFVVIGYDIGVLYEAKRALPEVPCHLVSRFVPDPETVWTPTADALIRMARAWKLDGLAVSVHGPVHAAFVSKVLDAGFQLFAWTVDDVSRAAELLGLGMHGITTNRPQWMREQLAAHVTVSSGDADTAL